MTTKKTKKDYENYLNEIYTNYIDYPDQFTIGGKLRRSFNYGSMIRKHDPIGFQVGYNEWVNNY